MNSRPPNATFRLFGASAGAFVFSLSLVASTTSHPPLTRSAAQTVVEGLKLWRKPGATERAASCATCHSPDGIELAEYAFDDADIERRAIPHVGQEDAKRIVAYIHSLREQLHITSLRDPNTDRPLQPGGSILPGSDPAARDYAFGLELRNKLPRLCGAPIETVSEAKLAEKELLGLQPNNLRIGIPLNPLSEDIAHGNQHSSIAQWLPEVAPSIEPADLDTWYRAEDEYLQNPTQEELHQLLLLHSRLVNTSRMTGMDAISALKFRALLVLQDRMRSHTEQSTDNVSADVEAYGNYNPIWAVGDFARDMISRDPTSVGMDPSTQAKKLAGPPFSEQLHSLRVSWFWAGWLSDQGLCKSSHDDKTRFGMWLSESLSKDGPYPIHNVYANARRQAVVSNDPTAWGEPLARKRRIWDFAGLRSFRQYWTDIPKESAYKSLYLRFTANCFRMNILLLKDDIAHTGEVWIRQNTKANAGELLDFVAEEDPSDRPATELLRQQLFGLADHAKERY